TAGFPALAAQLFLAAASVTGLVVAALYGERLRAERELREGLTLLRGLVDGTTDVVYVKDSQGRYRLFNAAASAATGRSAAEALGRDDTFLFPPDEAREVMRGDRGVLEAGETRTYEETVTAADGTRTTYLSTKGPLRDAQGEVTGLFGIARDVTASKSAEVALRESNELLSLFLKHSPIYAFIKEVTPTRSRVLQASENFVEMVGVPGSKMVGRTMEELFPPDFAAKISADDWAVVSEGRALQVEEDLGDRHYTTYKFPIRLGERDLLAGYTVDVTELKRAEAAALESKASEQRHRERLSSAVEIAGLGFYEQGMAGTEVFLDDRARELLGLTGEEPGGAVEFWLSRVHPEDRPALLEARRRFFAEGGERASVEYRYLHPRRGTIWLHQAARVLERDAAGRVARQIGVLRDVTLEREAEASRADLAEQLRRAQKMEAIGTLAGGIAHDFNNILTPILMNAEMALRYLDDPDSARDALGEILVAAERAKDLVRQILTISRKEPDAPLAPVPLGPLVKEVAKFLAASLPSTIEIRTEVDPTCGAVVGDLSQLHQVLLNLCTNAGYAMQERGGVLTVALGHAPEKGDGRWLRLSVRDTGPGIPPAVLGRIFEPYFTTKPAGKGTGLGLAVVQGVVTNLGGTVSVESRPGEGTTFEVLLPEADRAALSVVLDLPEAPRGEGQRVLVVDDEPAIREVVERVLLSLGYRVTACAGSAEALAAFGADPGAFDAVLTDYTMPGMNGLDLAAELMRLRPDLPVLLGTGYAESVSEELVAARGLRALLMKPYTKQKIGEALRRELSKRGAGRA
ncbi:MAG: PAS domain-containing protein, partial [Deltaproteobacteria bacterium]|nr:PAS domain-containing protein [Deltaproteobacteria bacterium]